MVCIVVGLLVMVGAVLVGMYALAIHDSNYASFTAELPSWSLSDQDRRVLIFSPHCDDETLACGGLINRLLARHAKVLVVFATNGDAFRIACVKQFHKVNVKDSDFVNFGYCRESEVLSAVGRLGLDKKNVIFLGYPDRGLSHMWMEDWDYSSLFSSAYTGSTHSPYKTSYHKNAPQCGRSLVDDLKQILLSFRPTSVYYPHTFEQHPDHWAAGCFMIQALYDAGMIDKVKTGLYLVHRGDWPVPQGIHTDLALPPPAKLVGLGTKWYEFDLPPDAVDKKLDAIRLYTSQTAIMGRFLDSFARTNELFGSYPPVSLQSVRSIGGTSDVRWGAVLPCILDPVGDTINVDVGRAGDIEDLRACYDAKHLHIRTGLAYNRSDSIVYTTYIHTLPAGGRHPFSVQVHGSKCSDPDVRATADANSVEVAIPLTRLGKWTALMISADSKCKGITLDRTAWRLLLASPLRP